MDRVCAQCGVVTDDSPGKLTRPISFNRVVDNLFCLFYSLLAINLTLVASFFVPRPPGMTTHHPSPEKLSAEDAHSPASRIPLIQGYLTMWRGGVPGEVPGQRRFFRLWDRYLSRRCIYSCHTQCCCLENQLLILTVCFRELVHYECDATQV